MPASNSCPLAFKMLSLLLTKTESETVIATFKLFVIFAIFNDSLVKYNFFKYHSINYSILKLFCS